MSSRQQGLFVVASWIAVLAGASAEAQVQFVDVAPQVGTAVDTWGRGTAFVDLDQDGLLDVVAANAGMNMSVFRQRADHTFEDAYALFGLADDDRAHWGVLAADFDNDGDPDLYVMNGGFDGQQPNQLLRNDIPASGVLTDVSAQSGDADLSKSTFGGTALDFDRDGRLDIFLSNMGHQGCTLLRNLGGLVFENVSASAGIAEAGGTYRHCSAGDIDNDGWVDVAVGDMMHDNLVYRNNGDGTFTEVAAQVGLSSPGDNFGLVLEDFDNDGWMDAYLPKYQQNPTGPSLLFLNNRDGTFRDVTSGSGMTGQSDMGHNTGDADGDGHPDVYIGTGSPSKRQYDKLFLITPDGLGGLIATDVSDSSGLTSNGKTRSHGLAFGDYDGDGDVDLYQNNGGPQGDPRLLETSFLWQNQGNGSGWLEVDLIGVLSNRSAIGARSRVRVEGGREIHRFQSAGKGFGNTDSATVHFGLGTDTVIEELFVQWPSGISQRLLAPPTGRRIAVLETGLRLLGEPTPGAKLTLEACGPAGEDVDVFLAAATDWLPLPPLGVLELASPRLRFLQVTLGSAGTAAVTLDVPTDTSLVGLTVQLQACVHPPGAGHGLLTNRIELAIR